MRKIFLSVAMMSSALTVMADKTIKGVVRDANEPLPFANVVIKGTTVGTNTDMDGNYEIEVPEGAILEFSYAGYNTVTKKITAKTSSVMNITLEQEMLEELVVTGYGVSKKRDLTGSVSSLDESKLKESVATSIDQAMAGRVSGVSVTSSSGQPGAATTVRVRGVSSLSGSTEPLYVVDGMPIGGGDASHSASSNPLASINPADIVSMEVLKDASATAIYGSRAANGVVMITTRKGKSGDAKITYDGSFSVQQFTKRYDMMNLKEYAEYINDPAVKEYRKEEPGILLTNPSELGEGIDWQDELFRNGIGHSHQVSASGGSDKTQYNISLGYTGQEGIMPSSDYKRINGRVNLESQAKDWMKVGMNVGVTRQEKKSIRYIYNPSANSAASIGNNKSLDESIILQTLLQLPSSQPYAVDGLPFGPEDNYGVKMNPKAALDMSPVERTEFNVLGTAFVDFTLFDLKKKEIERQKKEAEANGETFNEPKGLPENRLSWRNEFGIDVTNADENYFEPSYKISDGFFRKDFEASLTTGNYKNNSIRFSSYATWLHDFNKKHNLTMMVGTEFNKYSYEGVVMNFKGYSEGALQIPSGSTEATSVTSNFVGDGAMASFFGRANYSIANGKYILTATGRFDGSSNFAPGNKWGFFPSVSFAWRLDEEDWAQGSFKEVFSSFKVRAGYGQTGNANCAQAHLTTVTNVASSGIYGPGTYTNDNLKWETNSMANVGLDFGIKKVNITIDGYYKKNTDLLLEQELPSYVAQSNYLYMQPSYVNAGSIQNVGMDLTIGSQLINKKIKDKTPFTWETDLTFSLVRSKVLDLGSSCEAIWNKPDYEFFTTTQKINKTVVNEAPGMFWGKKYIGVAKTQKEADAYNEHTPWSQIGVGDMMYEDEEGFIGDPNPAFTAGWSNSFSVGQWTLNVQFNATVGNDVYNVVRMKLEQNSADSKWYNQLADVLNCTKVEGTGADAHVVSESSIPVPTATDKGQKFISDRYVENGSFLRLQNVGLTYKFRPEANRKLHIEGLRLTASCSNVCTITGYSGYDPENPGGAIRQGVDEARYPSPRTYTLGLGFSF